MIERKRFLPAVLSVWLSAAGAIAAAPQTPETTEATDQIAKLIAELDSDRYAVRRDATRQLEKAGQAAIEALRDAAQTGSSEVGVRAVTILRAIYLSGDEATIDEVELALEQLKTSKNGGVAGRADRVLALNYDVRERRAIAEIHKLGGTIRYDNPFVPSNDPNADRKPSAIVIGPNWKGGDEGLRHVKRLTKLTMVYRISGDHVSDVGIKDLQQALPKLRVHLRGRAYLGVGASTSARMKGCLIGRVESGSAADKAGIRLNDVLIGFGGKPVDKFETLIDLIRSKKPGDKVEMAVKRGGRLMTLEVIMGEWKKY